MTPSYPTSLSDVINMVLLMMIMMNIVITHFRRSYTDVLSLIIELNLITYIQKLSIYILHIDTFVYVQTLKSTLHQNLRFAISLKARPVYPGKLPSEHNIWKQYIVVIFLKFTVNTASFP